MSTRATIQIRQRVNGEGTEPAVINLYHHSSGYPEGVGADLKRWLKGRNDGCGDNNVMWDCDCIATDLVKGRLTSPDQDGNEKADQNYQVTFGQHGDEEYAYVIDCDKMSLKCYHLNSDQYDWSNAPEMEIPDKTWYEPRQPEDAETARLILVFLEGDDYKRAKRMYNTNTDEYTCDFYAEEYNDEAHALYFSEQPETLNALESGLRAELDLFGFTNYYFENK